MAAKKRTTKPRKRSTSAPKRKEPGLLPNETRDDLPERPKVLRSAFTLVKGLLGRKR
ncbi:MAG: hypothetical protein ACJ790_02880 [Myxococcaceae bacterium]